MQLHYESDMAEVLKKLVMEGEGVAWLPRSAIAAELAAGELVPAGPAAWNLDVELRVYRDVSNRVNSWTRSGSTCARRLRGSAESGFSRLMRRSHTAMSHRHHGFIDGPYHSFQRQM